MSATLGCFTPVSAADNATEGETDGTIGGTGPSGTSTTASTSMSEASTTGDPETTSPTSETTQGTDDTGPDAPCTDNSECDGGLLCIDELCQPCTAASDPDAACAAQDPNVPLCDADTGQCAICVAATCSGMTPVCDAAVGCVACTEHSQCPESACHLLGPDQGECFDIADVVEVSDTTELENEIDAIGPGAQLVVNLTAETFSLSGTNLLTSEIAFLGQPGTVITGGATYLFYNQGSYLYFSGLRIQDGPNYAVRCDMGGGVWFDDTDVSGYPVPLGTDCESHIRRSRFDAPAESIAISVSAGGSLFMENSAVGPTAAVGILLDGAAADLRYVTVAGNALGIECTNGPSGEVRNSILVTPTGTAVSGAFALTFIDNAVSEPGFGEFVDDYQESWFADPAAGDFHLSASGEAVFADLADWDEGDPLLDIDGDARPQAVAGYVGYDEVP